ncbi:MAG: DAK2 domain-containing protein [Lachnospiraceae bacterium]|nr:DAK2 domain-containing protein [Lachnospiraceae bacterium]
MSVNSISSDLLMKMFFAGAKRLEAKKEWINELNVFPVPDGDTGTNMCMTIMSAVSFVSEVEEVNMLSVSKAMSSGSLRGARGNSGVILSQLLRGFTNVTKECTSLDIPTITDACQKAVETAYKAVMKPKEGTILTVARGMAEKALTLAEECDDLETYIDELIKEGEAVLEKTPDMLPVLKQAGVVDSGGQGLIEVLKGAQEAFLGKEIDYSSFEAPSKGAKVVASEEEISEEDIKFGYCTEFIINLESPISSETEAEYKAFLESIGDSIVVVADDDLVKTHVHTNHPGEAIEKALTLGSLSKLKIDNMREEHREKLFKAANKANDVIDDVAKKNTVNKVEFTEPPKEFGFVSVAVGEGISNIFKELGVDYVIEGGQTMNPSTDDILNGIARVNAKTVFVLPNNKNIILAANQAVDICEDKKVIVIPTKTIPQGISSLINYIPDNSAEENAEKMTESLEYIKSGNVTYAVRDTEIDDKVIKEGDYMGITDDGIKAVDKKLETCVLSMIDEMIDDESSIVSIYFGADIKENQAEKIASKIEKKYPDMEVEIQEGGQPVYSYIVSVE